VVPWSLRSLLPGDAPRLWRADLKPAAGARFVAVRVVHPLKNGKPFHFANADQSRHAKGWLTLGELLRQE